MNIFGRSVWWHVVHHDKRDGRTHFAKKLYVHIGSQTLGFYLSLFGSLALIDMEFSSTDDEDFNFSLAVYKLFYFGFSVGTFKLVHKLPGVRWNGKWGSGAREIRLSWRPWTWHWSLWTYPQESKNWWRDGYFDLADFLLGRERYSEIRGEIQEASIPMPEGEYPAKITFVQRHWKRPRWPSIRRRVDADIEMIEPIPVPGDGENDWDCGEDAICAGSYPASTTAEAIAAIRASALKQRGQTDQTYNKESDR